MCPICWGLPGGRSPRRAEIPSENRCLQSIESEPLPASQRPAWVNALGTLCAKTLGGTSRTASKARQQHMGFDEDAALGSASEGGNDTDQHNQASDMAARHRLILRHQKLAWYIAARFANHGETAEDLAQVAMIGLIHAVDRYDPAQAVKFSTFAVPTIVGEIKRHLRDRTWQVKIPRWLLEMSLSARRANKALTGRLGRSPSVAEIAAEIGASEEETLEALEVGRIAQVASLDMPLSREDSDGATLADRIGGIDQALHDLDAYADLMHALGRLEEREQRVVRLRFFDELSQRQIAKQMGLSQMHVSRLERRALEKLRGLLPLHQQRS